MGDGRSNTGQEEGFDVVVMRGVLCSGSVVSFEKQSALFAKCG